MCNVPLALRSARPLRPRSRHQIRQPTIWRAVTHPSKPSRSRRSEYHFIWMGSLLPITAGRPPMGVSYPWGYEDELRRTKWLHVLYSIITNGNRIFRLSSLAITPATKKAGAWCLLLVRSSQKLSSCLRKPCKGSYRYSDCLVVVDGGECDATVAFPSPLLLL